MRTTPFSTRAGRHTTSTPSSRTSTPRLSLTVLRSPSSSNGEDTADGGGLAQSYRAWTDRYDSDRSGLKYPNYLLPGLDAYSRMQLFYIGESSCTSLLGLVLTNGRDSVRTRMGEEHQACGSGKAYPYRPSLADELPSHRTAVEQ
jgi:hypothetical protein